MYVLFVVWSHNFLHTMYSQGCDFTVVYANLQLSYVVFIVSVLCVFIYVSGCLIHIGVIHNCVLPR